MKLLLLAAAAMTLSAQQAWDGVRGNLEVATIEQDLTGLAIPSHWAKHVTVIYVKVNGWSADGAAVTFDYEELGTVTPKIFFGPRQKGMEYIPILMPDIQAKGIVPSSIRILTVSITGNYKLL